ncbi:hypothetical protein TheetDRAFT_3218 [Thermoanaerobacter ethanolicus JW 200]|nr:hypothetical protein TheetDRAFT_3218 [Thermoanaerobacter ethanolicus JW 200]
MFALNIPIPLHSLKVVYFLSFIIVPIVVRLPFEMIYPTGDKQLKIDSKKYERFYKEADIIAGISFYQKYMPERLDGKIIVTNTVTQEDVEMIKERGWNY